MKRELLSLAVVALLGCNPPAPKTVQPAPPRDPWPQGTVLVSRNPQETDNRTPGFWNHLAIYTGNFQLVESQEGRGVITTTTKEYNARGYTWYPLFPKDIHQGVVAAAKAQTLVGLPYRAGSSLLGEDRNPERGLNCVSVVRISYASAVGHGFPELKIPDNIVLLDGDVLTKTNPKK